MRRARNQRPLTLDGALLSFRTYRILFLLSTVRLLRVALGCAITALVTTLSQLKSWLVFQWDYSLWRPAGKNADKTSSES